MVTKSKLKMSLAAEKGTDFGKKSLKKKEKAARKKAGKGGDVEVKSNKTNGDTAEEWEDVESEDEDGGVQLKDLEGESGSDEDEEIDDMQVCS